MRTFPFSQDRQHNQLLVVIIVLFLTAAFANADPPASPLPPTDIPNPTPIAPQDGNAGRTLLTRDNLLNGFDYSSPVDESALTPPIDAAPPAQLFEGRLELRGEGTTGEMTVLRGTQVRNRRYLTCPNSISCLCRARMALSSPRSAA